MTTPRGSDPVVKTKQLTKQYGDKKSVDALDIEIHRGEIYGFLGPNGAGKSTTMKLLLGLAQPTSGSAELFGMEMNDKNRQEILRRTGSLIEAPSYYGHLTAEENMHIIETLLDLPEGSGAHALEIVRLSGQKDKKVRAFSLGMKQRLGIAMALVRSPELLILDEPINGLDPAGIEEIRGLLKHLAKDYGITIMLSSHLLDEIEKTADHVGIIKDGRLIFEGSMAALNERRRPLLVIETQTPEAVATYLRQYGAQADGIHVRLPGMDAQKRRALLKDLIEKGFSIDAFYSEQKSLEALFLDLTGGAQSL